MDSPRLSILLSFISSVTILHAQPPKLVLPIGHTQGIKSAQFSPDGKKIVTASMDNTAKIWDAVSGKLLVDLKGHRDWVSSAIFSPDGKKILTTSWDSTAKIWDVVSGNLIVDLKAYRNIVLSAQFSPDGKKIITVAGDSTAKIWNAINGNLLSYHTGDKEKIRFAQFSPDGKKIITLSDQKKLFQPAIGEDIVWHAEVWDVDRGNLLVDFEIHDEWVRFAEFSPDGKKIVTVSKDSTAKIWSIINGKLLTVLEGNKENFRSAKFSPARPDDSTGGKNIITTSYYNTIKIWDAVSGKLLAALDGQDGWFSSAEFSPDGKKFVTAYKSEFKIWDAVTGKLLVDLIRDSTGLGWSPFAGHVCSAQFSPDGKKIITVSSISGITDSPNKYVEIWDAVTGKFIADLKGHTDYVVYAQFSPVGPDDPIGGKKIVTASWDDNNTARVWDAATGKILVDLKNENDMIWSTQFNPEGNKIVTVSSKIARIWDAVTGKLLVRLKDNKGWIQSAKFSRDGKKIIIRSDDSTLTVWDVATGKMLVNLKDENVMSWASQFSPDGEKIITVSENKNANIRDAASGKILFDLKGKGVGIRSAQFSPDGKKIVTTHRYKTAKIWDVVARKLLIELKGKRQFIESAQFNSDGKKIITFSGTGASIWDALTGNLLVVLKGNVFGIRSVEFSLDGKKIIVLSNDERFFGRWLNSDIAYDAKVWDADNGNLLVHNEFVHSAELSPNGKKVMIASSDNTVKVLDAGTGELLYKFFVLDSTDYFSQTFSGFYQCTPNAAKLLHYVTKDLKVISFEQLDVKYNRPDKVLEAMGNTDTALISAYKNAYNKRLKRLGIDTGFFSGAYSVPVADFINRDSLEYEQVNENLNLQIHGVDSTYLLDRFNVWVNDVPVYGLRGISIKQRNSNSFDTSVTINLSQGENRVETSVFNVNGTESYRIPLYIKFIPDVPKKEMAFFVGIGINNFADSSHPLLYSVKDIRDMADSLKKRNKDIVIDTLFDRNVTINNIKDLKKKLLQTTENDKVIIAYSGHGLLSKDYDYYLSTYAVNFDKPEQNGLPYDELENLLDSIPARKKLMLIDACHSGEVDKEELKKMMEVQQHLDSKQKGLIIIVDTANKRLGIKNSFELMQQLFVNAGKSTGATIISAAAGTQFALERGDLKNGVFTYSILEAMNQHRILKVSELKRIVVKRVEDLTKGLQKPTSRNETNNFDWELW